MTDYIEVKDLGNLEELEDKKIKVKGSISDLPWQHLIHQPETHPVINYFDVGRLQIVIYSKEEISYKGLINVFGTIIKIVGKSKRPEIVKRHWEYQMIVDKWEKAE